MKKLRRGRLVRAQRVRAGLPAASGGHFGSPGLFWESELPQRCVRTGAAGQEWPLLCGGGSEALRVPRGRNGSRYLAGSVSPT